MIEDIQELNDVCERSNEFRATWPKVKIQWHPSNPPEMCRRRKLRRRILDEINIQLDNGREDENEITQEVCKSLIGTIILSVAIELLVKLMVKKILEWRERRK